MQLTARERAKLDDFEQIYRQVELPAVREVERRVCGCSYGATSWTTRAEAKRIANALDLRPELHLLDIGAGAGWPGLYLARLTGCELTLSDLPASGLEVALRRAAEEGLAGRCRAVLADAASLPLESSSIDAVNQSDVLCCLVQKEAVLRESRRVIRPGGRMACSVIYVPPGLGAVEHARAVETAPDFVETETEYPVLFARTGWRMTDRLDLTEAFADACRKKVQAESDLRAELEPILGGEAMDAHHARMGRRLEVLARGHLRRELFFLDAVARRHGRTGRSARSNLSSSPCRPCGWR